MREKLIELRVKMGYTQVTFAKRLGISRSHYSQIEEGHKNPTFAVSLKIKYLLGCERDDIFMLSDVKPRKGGPRRPRIRKS